MSHLRLPPVGDGLGALEPPEFWFCGLGGGGGAALLALPSWRLILMPSWGGCCEFAAFAAPSSGVYKMMMSARRHRFEGVGGDSAGLLCMVELCTILGGRWTAPG